MAADYTQPGIVNFEAPTAAVLTILLYWWDAFVDKSTLGNHIHLEFRSLLFLGPSVGRKLTPAVSGRRPTETFQV